MRAGVGGWLGGWGGGGRSAWAGVKVTVRLCASGREGAHMTGWVDYLARRSLLV